MDKNKCLKELLQEARNLIYYYQYALWYNRQVDVEKENKRNYEKVKKLVLTKKFMGKDILVD